MRSKLIYIFAPLLVSFSLVFLFWYQQSSQTLPQELQIKPAHFSDLPGWNSNQTLSSLHTFQRSCRQFLRQNPNRPVGNQWFALQAKDWQPVCKAALEIHTHSESVAKQFFETWFQPVEFVQKKSLTGLFTGYYLPSFAGNLTKTQEFSVPLYGVPNNLLQINLQDFDSKLPARQLMGRLEKNRMVPYYSREEIDQGALEDKAPVLVYLRSPIDRLLIEIQGSGIITLPDNTRINLGYAGKNGLTYTSIGRVLIERNILTSNNVSIQNIRRYLETHPTEQEDIIHQNRSFVFFTTLQQKGAFGTQGTRLTRGYSLAVDPDWVPLGMPVWLATTYPDPDTEQNHPLRRLMIAQDTGGAIKGTVRGDVYWGNGNAAAAIAGKMKSKGQYWLLVPKTYMTSSFKKH